MNKPPLKAPKLALLALATLLAGCQTPPRHSQPTLGDWYGSQAKTTAQEPTKVAIAKPTYKQKLPDITADNPQLDPVNDADLRIAVAQSAQKIKDEAPSKSQPSNTLRSTSAAPSVNPNINAIAELNQQLKIYKNARESLNSAQANPALVGDLETKILALEIKKADELYAESPDKPEIYALALRDLKTWLAANPNHSFAEDYRYQLARLQDITGETDAAEATLTQLREANPNLPSKRQQEIDFRIAEGAFAKRDYAKAIKNYSAVLVGVESQNNDFQHLSKALYMRGWSQLQENQFKPALQDFLLLLDRKSTDAIDQQMLSDTYRGITLAINDAGGLTELPNLVDLEKFRPHAKDIYNRMITFYKKEERWSEVIEAYQQFQNQYPGTDDALNMALELLTFLEENDQKASLREEKSRFIAQYAKQAPTKSAEFTLELAEYYRAEALKKTEQSDDFFQQSLGYYKMYLEQFSDELDRNKSIFDYAETLIEAGDISQARVQLAKLNSDKVPAKLREKAAYLSLTSIDSQDTDLDTTAVMLRDEKIQLAKAFINDYPQHKKASEVLEWLMVNSFKTEQFEQAIEYAELAEKQHPSIGEVTQQIKADSLLSLKRWAPAAAAYEALIKVSSKPKAIWRTNALKAYYQAARTSEPEQALPLFAKVYNANEPELSAAALFDAALVAEKIKQPLSIELYKRYLRDYPKESNVKDVRLKLASIYKSQENWLAAAPLLVAAAQDLTDPELKRAADLEIADLYYKGDDKAKALAAYKALLQSNNLQKYQQQAEARARLISLYKDQGQNQAAFKEMKTYVQQDTNASSATKKTRETAEDYAMTLAGLETKVYEKMRLTQDLQGSFKRKQAAMEAAIQSYKKLEEFESTKARSFATAGIGNLFADLSKALLEAPVPPGLNELEREEYMIIVEEQAFPLEEKALEFHEKNITLLHDGEWSEGIETSLKALRTIMPARFDKQERFEGAIPYAE